MERILRLPVAMRDTKVFLKLLQLELAVHPPGAPITKVWIVAEPAPPRSAQRGLFLPVTPEAEKLEITLARINGIVGERRAGIARLLDTHRRDGFLMDRFVASAEELEACGSSHTVRCRGKDPIGFTQVSPAMAAAGQTGRRTSGRLDGGDKTNPSRRPAGKGFMVSRTMAILRRLVDGKRERGKHKQRSDMSLGPRRMGCCAR